MIISIPLPLSLIQAPNISNDTLKSEMKQQFKGLLQPPLCLIENFSHCLYSEEKAREIFSYIETLHFKLFSTLTQQTTSQDPSLTHSFIEIYDDTDAHLAHTSYQQNASFVSELNTETIDCLKQCVFEMFKASARALLPFHRPLNLTDSFFSDSISTKIYNNTALLHFNLFQADFDNYSKTQKVIASACQQLMQPIALQPNATLKDFCKDKLTYFVKVLHLTSFSDTPSSGSSYHIWIFERSSLSSNQLAEATTSKTLLKGTYRTCLDIAIFKAIHRYFSELIMQHFWETNSYRALVSISYLNDFKITNQPYFLLQTQAALKEASTTSTLSIHSDQSFENYSQSLVYICRRTQKHLLVKVFESNALTNLQLEASYTAYSLEKYQQLIIEHQLKKYLMPTTLKSISQ